MSNYTYNNFDNNCLYKHPSFYLPTGNILNTVLMKLNSFLKLLADIFIYEDKIEV